jgi:hypothetical protein
MSARASARQANGDSAMPRVYLDKYSAGPRFSNERGVGVGMANDPKDVMLIQFFLKAIMFSNKAYLGQDLKFTPPPGVALNINGVWDEPSRAYLSRWEEIRAQVKAYWAYGRVDAVQFPGTVVPYMKGGKKILSMNEMIIDMYGRDQFKILRLPTARLPDEAWHDLFYDPVRGPQGSSAWPGD